MGSACLQSANPTPLSRKERNVLNAYRQHVAERAALGIPPLPLTAQQTKELVALLMAAPKGEEQTLVELLTFRVPAGVDDAAKVKAAFLAKIASGEEKCPLVSPKRATELLGTMLGGFNIQPLIALLDSSECGATAAEALKKTLLMFEAFHDVKETAAKGRTKDAGADPATLAWILSEITIGPGARLPGGVAPATLIEFRDALIPKLRALAFRRVRRDP